MGMEDVNTEISLLDIYRDKKKPNEDHRDIMERAYLAVWSPVSWLNRKYLDRDFAIYRCFEKIIGSGLVGFVDRLVQEDDKIRE